MSATPQHVQTLIDQAVAELKQTTKSGTQMVKSYGSDTSKWGVGHWPNALSLLADARNEAGQLVPPPPPPPPAPSFTVAIAGIPVRGQTLKATVTS